MNIVFFLQEECRRFFSVFFVLRFTVLVLCFLLFAFCAFGFLGDG